MPDETRPGDPSSPDSPADPTPGAATPQPTSVDELIARLGAPEQPSRRRRRREDDDDTQTIAVGELLAALRAGRTETDGPAEAPSREQASGSPAAQTTEGTPAASAAQPTESTPAAAQPTEDTPAAAEPSTGDPSGSSVRPTAPGTAGAAGAATAPRAGSSSSAPGPVGSASEPTAGAGADGSATDDTADGTELFTHAGPAPRADRDQTTQLLPALSTPPADPDAEEIRRSLRAAADRDPQPAAAILSPAAAATGTAAPRTATRPASTSSRTALYAGRILVALLSTVVLVATGLYSVIIARGNSALAERSIDAVDFDDSNIVQPTGTAPDGPVLYAPENILLIGSDTRSGSNAEIGAGGEGAEGESANSDTMMIAHLSADRQRVQVLSIPRDLLIDAPDNCYGWNFRTGEVSDQIWEVGRGERWQINSAFSVGGPRCLVTAVQKTTGIRIDRVISIDFVGFADMVDALGGLQADVCTTIDDEQLGLIVAAGGDQVLEGQQTLNLVRARKVKGTPQSDHARVERQQKVLSAMLRQVTSAGTLLNPAALDSFLQAFARNVQPDNVTLEDMIALATSLGDLSPGRVTFYSLPTFPSTERPGRVELDPVLGPAVFDAIINDLPLPSDEVQEPVEPTPSAPSTPTTTAPVAPTVLTVAAADVDLRIWNVTGRAGAAGEAQTALNDLGFEVAADDLVRDDDNEQAETTVLFAEADRAAALTVLAAVPGAVAVVDDSMPIGEIRLMIGSEFDQVFAESVELGDPVSSSEESTAVEPAPGTPNADPDQGGGLEITSLQPTDLPAVNAATVSCI